VLGAFLSTISFHLLSCYLLVDRWNLGVQGAAMAQALTSFLNMAFIMVYSRWIAHEDLRVKVFLVNKEIIRWSAVKEYLKISLPSMTMLCLEWWSYEILTLIASFISITALGAQTIAYNFF
jgi:multidrug resistance protein, MATE family